MSTEIPIEFIPRPRTAERPTSRQQVEETARDYIQDPSHDYHRPAHRRKESAGNRRAAVWADNSSGSSDGLHPAPVQIITMQDDESRDVEEHYIGDPRNMEFSKPVSHYRSHSAIPPTPSSPGLAPGGPPPRKSSLPGISLGVDPASPTFDSSASHDVHGSAAAKPLSIRNAVDMGSQMNPPSQREAVLRNPSSLGAGLSAEEKRSKRASYVPDAELMAYLQNSSSLLQNLEGTGDSPRQSLEQVEQTGELLEPSARNTTFDPSPLGRPATPDVPTLAYSHATPSRQSVDFNMEIHSDGDAVPTLNPVDTNGGRRDFSDASLTAPIKKYRQMLSNDVKNPGLTISTNGPEHRLHSPVASPSTPNSFKSYTSSRSRKSDHSPGHDLGSPLHSPHSPRLPASPHSSHTPAHSPSARSFHDAPAVLREEAEPQSAVAESADLTAANEPPPSGVGSPQPYQHPHHVQDDSVAGTPYSIITAPYPISPRTSRYVTEVKILRNMPLPKALEFRDVTLHRTRADRIHAYRNKLRDLQEQSSGLKMWIISHQGKGPPQRGVRGGSAALAYASMNSTMKSTRSDATFAMRSDAVHATEVMQSRLSITNPAARSSTFEEPRPATSSKKVFGAPNFASLSSKLRSQSIPIDGSRGQAPPLPPRGGLSPRTGASPASSASSTSLRGFAFNSNSARSTPIPGSGVPTASAVSSASATTAAGVAAIGAAPSAQTKGSSFFSTISRRHSKKSEAKPVKGPVVAAAPAVEGAPGYTKPRSHLSYRRQDNMTDNTAYVLALDKLCEVMPHVERPVLASYLDRAGGDDMKAIGLYFEDEKAERAGSYGNRPY